MKVPTRAFQNAYDLLMKEAEPCMEVEVRFERVSETFASVRVEEGQFVIRVDDRLSTMLAVHFLVHEWAHCIVWSDGPLIKDHGDAWSLVYGRLYRRVFDE